jgi:tetratricopeptide (TPR) repeat protein
MALFGLTACLVLSTAGCKRDPAARAADYIERGKASLNARDFSRAILQFKNAIRVHPKETEAYYQLGLAFLANGDLGLGVVAIKKATDLDPKHAGAQVKMAEMLAMTRNQDMIADAQKKLKSVLDASPNNADAQYWMAITDWMSGRSQDAETRLVGLLSQFPKELSAARTLALIKLNKQDFAAAEATHRKAVESAPNSVDAVLALGTLHVLMGKPKDVETDIKRVLELNPKDGQALLTLVRLQVYAGQREEAEKTLVRLSALPDKEYKPLHALYLFSQGKHDAALAELESLSKSAPQDRDARQRLVEAYLSLNRIPDAQRVIDKAIAANAKDVDAKLTRSRIYLSQGRYKDAEKDVTEVLHFKPDSAQAHYTMARVHEALGRTQSRRLELSEALRFDSRFLPARLDLARVFLMSHSARSGQELLEAAPTHQREQLPVITLRNWTLLAVENYPEARKGIDRGLRLRRTDDLLVQDAVVRIQTGDVAGGRKSAEEALELAPGNVAALNTLVRSWVVQGKIADGIGRAKVHVEKHPKVAVLQFALGRWLLRNGQSAEARKAFADAWQADPNYWESGLELGLLDMKENRNDSARQIFERAAAFPAARPQAEIGLGMLDEKAGNSSGAVVHYRKVIELEPNNPIALNNLAFRVASDTGQIDEALRYAQQAMETAPDYPAIESTIGWLYYKKGMFDNAVGHLESAVKGQPSATHKYLLAMAYLKTGKRELGQRMYEDARRLDAGRPEAQEVERLLAETRQKR